MAYFGQLGRMMMQKIGSNASRSVLSQNVGAAAVPGLFLLQSRGMASSKLFIGGLSWGTDEKTLRDAFASFGEVTDVRIITDRDTGRSRGFGFVSYTSDAEAQNALQEMDGRDLAGRTIRVDYATDRTQGDGAAGGGFGGRPGGFGGRPGGNRQGGGGGAGGGSGWRGY
ncbi:hypothetical protein MPTK1_1g21200 [Marchantia polymorpha subsp. ruderalis]|uniref:RRM domain-containing protein n=2 Tax=Marchantia polymorpha TaxID=3197 RepID=A0AAF6ASK4_MARPO|nr:hypothetical protein MARPO_0001s0454 [Marchantia polymorpha]BBM99424.1 hypothetical protein Mp_1g21200 [Marchantia polymorpha subsp. ruderalis]|eukprot:PTQ50505.1 hypothetical protein MARPO_0001s0454 [Marchantia polymorpha]